MPDSSVYEAIAINGWPFDLAATLHSGQAFHWHRLENGFAGMIGPEPVFLSQPEPAVVLCSAGMREKVRHYLGLDTDLRGIIASFVKDDAILQKAVAWCPGLRLLRQPRWECLATFITSSLKQVGHIRQISLKLREQFGTPLQASGLPLQYSYPTPDVLAAAGEAALRACGLGYRAGFLHRAAIEVAAKRIDLEAIAELPDAEALMALCSLRGVGEKIASCALLFGWGRYGVFPVDVWIERTLRTLYFPGEPDITAKAIRKFAQDHFGPYRGYAQQYLFHWARLTGCGTRASANGTSQGPSPALK